MPPRKKKIVKEMDEDEMYELGIYNDDDEEKRDESEDWRDVG